MSKDDAPFSGALPTPNPVEGSMPNEDLSSSGEPSDSSRTFDKPYLLCVDDEPYVLEGLVLHLRRQFEVHTAHGGLEALKLMAQEPKVSYAIVISDMRMPGMDGATFLNQIRQLYPDTTRILLTGYADQEAAVRAVNESQIFRYLSKPFPTKELLKVCQKGLSHYNFNKAQKDVLKQTLRGSVSVLTQILGMINPSAVGRTARILTVVRHLVAKLELTESWQFEIAAMLSQIGCVTLPTDTLARVDAVGPLSLKERLIYRNHPQIAADLIEKIPRLGTVSQMIRRQLEPFPEEAFALDLLTADRAILGAQVLRVAVDLGRLSQRGYRTADAVELVKNQRHFYHPALLEALGGLELIPPKVIAKYTNAEELTLDMVLDENVETTNGVSIVSKGAKITPEILDRLGRFARGAGIREPFRVLVKN